MDAPVNKSGICRKADRKGERKYKKNGGYIYTSRYVRQSEQKKENSAKKQIETMYRNVKYGSDTLRKV